MCAGVVPAATGVVLVMQLLIGSLRLVRCLYFCANHFSASVLAGAAQASSTDAVHIWRGGQEERNQHVETPTSTRGRSMKAVGNNPSKAAKREFSVSHKQAGWEEEPSDEPVEHVQPAVPRHPGVKNGAWTTLDALLVKQAQADVQPIGKRTWP